MKPQIAGLILIAALISGCGNKPGNTTVNEHSDTQQSDRLKLNNGEKWKVNEEMTPFIRNSEELLADFRNNNESDYKELAGKLKENNNKLISSCTMKGEAHDELHKWLYPHLELVKKLSKAKSTEEVRVIIDQLQFSFDTFNSFFQ